MEGQKEMKGFVVAIIIIMFVIGYVFTSVFVLNHRVLAVQREVEAGRYESARESLSRVSPFLHLCATDGLLREVDLAFCDILSDGEEEEKSRLLLLLEDLRRQVGLCPISIF